MRRNVESAWVRGLTVALVTLSLARVPLPIADFHVIGHRHGEGRACPLHDHLMRWHTAERSSQGPVLHFHWVLPLKSVATTDPQGATFRVAVPLDLEHLNDLPHPRDETSLSAAKETHCLVSPTAPTARLGSDHGLPPTAGHAAGDSNFAATFPPTVPPSCLLQRWVC